MKSILLPRVGEEVELHGLVSASEHNGKIGVVEDFVRDQLRYRVKLLDGDATDKTLGLKLANITARRKPTEAGLHLLIPCHVESLRRQFTFKQCVKSVNVQIGVSATVFVGLSTPSDDVRKQVLAFLSYMALQSGHSWYLQDEGLPKQAQMEHIRHLHIDSFELDTQALIMFLDNDDMCHPSRLINFVGHFQEASLPDGCTAAIPCKLLLDERMSPSEGKLENFVDMNNLSDFHHWRRKIHRKGAVTLVENHDVADMDADEYFDYIVPSHVVRKFFTLTPPKVTEHPFSDLRFWNILKFLAPMEARELPPDVWFLAHYKVSMDTKRETFDNHGDKSVAGSAQSLDQSSFNVSFGICPEDERLSEKYPKLSPGQVQMCRGHIESLVIQYIGWNPEEYDRAQAIKIKELNELHGEGFGNDLWSECDHKIRSLFGDEYLERNMGEWEDPLAGLRDQLAIDAFS